MRKLYLILAALSNIYFVALQVASPGTFWGTVFGYNIVWFLLSIALIALYFMDRHKVWSKVSDNLKNAFFGISLFLIIISSINMIFIVHPNLAQKEEQVDYVIVLGGGITKDAELTDSIKNRLSVAAEYLKKNPDAIAVVTGGKGPFSPCPEADVLKPYLESLGIEGERVLAENKAKDTIQNFQFSARLLAETQNKTLEEILESPVTVVTSDFHLARAERLARRLGYKEVYGVASRTPPLFILSGYGREILCYIKLNLRIMFTRQPSKMVE